jgi:ferrous-iron efflux pump FieF
MLGWPIMDPIFAIGIALYILYSAGQIGYEAMQLLMDHELPPEVHARIKEIVPHLSTGARGARRAHPPLRANLFHPIALMLDDQLPLVEAHRVADEVEAAINEAFPNADVLIHEDPTSELPPLPLPG